MADKPWEWVFSGIGLSVAGWLLSRWRKKPAVAQDNSSCVNNTFTSSVTVKQQDISQELLAKHAEELGETKQLIQGFLNTLLEREVPRDQWDSKLREIAATHKELLALVGDNQAATQAIERGDYAQAEMLLRTIADQRSMAAAKANADLAKVQEMQLRYTKAAAYWQQAAALLPKDKKKEQAYYLNAAGDNLNSIPRDKEAMALYEQSLHIRQEIGDREGEGTTLTNIGEIYRTRGDHIKAWEFLNQSLDIYYELGNRAMESTTLNNISQIHYNEGDYTTALKYLERSLRITQEIGDKKQEGATLNEISKIYSAWGDYTTALKHLEQALAIQQEIGDKAGEAVTKSAIGLAYKKQGDLKQGDLKQGDLKKAETHMTRAVQLAEEIGHPKLEEWRKELTKIRAESAGLRSWLRNLTIPSWKNGTWH